MVKIADPGEWRLYAHVVWRETYGPIPKGYVIHHHDEDTLNDEPENLRCWPKREHDGYHARRRNQYQYAA